MIVFFYLGQNQSSLRELKNENHFLKDYIHRLNAASSEYQTTHPPKTLKKDMHVRIYHILHTRVIKFFFYSQKEQRRMQGLPMKGPSPIWLVSLSYPRKLSSRFLLA